MTKLTLGKFVKELTALLEQAKIAIPFKNEQCWQFLFYELKKDREAAGRPQFLDDLEFDWDGSYPKSQKLSDFLHSLHWNASVSASNPHYETITLSDEVKGLWLQRLEAEDAETRKFFSSTIERARKEFGPDVKAETSNGCSSRTAS